MKRFFKYFTISITSSFFILILFISCSSNKIILEEKDGFDMVPSGDHKLATKTLSQGNVTVLFESGLGDSGNRWIFSGITQMLEEYAKVIVYCRAGIYPSDKTDTLATIENMIIDLDSVITTLADDDILILVGHSLGGAIIRAYSVKYPEKVSGLVFVDSSHEVSLQGRTDEYFAGKLQSLGIKEHNVVYKEFKEFQNTLKYLET
jgi:pimeloyl-ACP methyl ester carboxylesterase